MATRKNSTILPASKVKIHSRKLICRDQPVNPPQVTIQRDGDAINRIEVRCSCGEQIDLDCIYDDVSNRSQ